MEGSPEPGPSSAARSPQAGTSFQGHLDDMTAKISKKRVAHAPNPEMGDHLQLAKKVKSVAAATETSMKKKAKKSRKERKRDRNTGERSIAGDNVEVQEDLQPEVCFKVPPSPKKIIIASGSVVNKAKEDVRDSSVQRVLEHDLREHEAIDFNESILLVNHVKKAQKELDEMEASKRSSRRHKRKERKARKKAKSIKKKSQISETAEVEKPVTYRAVGSPGHDESPEVILREDDSALDWDEFLKDKRNWSRCRPIEDFPFAPLKELFKEWARKGLAVEVPNYFIDYKKCGETRLEVLDENTEPLADRSEAKEDEPVEMSWWCGTIIDFVGYKAIIQLEDLGTNPDREKYQLSLSLFSRHVRPLRWAGTNDKLLDPGPVVIGEILESDVLTSKIDAFYNMETISDEMFDAVEYDQNQKARSLRTHEGKWHCTPCPQYPDQFRILEFVKFQGDRLYLQFVDKFGELFEDDKKIIYHHRHRFLKPFMYAPAAGFNLLGTKVRLQGLAPSPNDFPHVPEELKIEVGMKCEVLYPKLQFKLKVAMVYEKFNYGYVMMEMAEERPDLEPEPLYRVYHITDPHLLPIGFGEKYGIEVEDNGLYAKEQPLNLSLLGERPKHPFEVGDKFEAVSTSHYDFVGPVTVKKKAGHLVLVHFDSWTDNPWNYHWIDPLHDEIYPAGYCEIFDVDWKGNVTCD